jgi:glycine hydroxymethyltransferase
LSLAKTTQKAMEVIYRSLNSQTEENATVFNAQIGEIRAVDPEVADAIVAERQRQEENIILIASENIASDAVMAAQGTLFTNKYAEGYPGKRYYGGCENVDICERLARSRAKELFSADHANVQPHSGASANLAVYTSFMKPGDKILSMSLDHGGHLSHGHKVNFTGKWYEIISYGVSKETGTLDYDEIERLALEHKPAIIVCGASAYGRTLDFERFGVIAKNAECRLLADIAHIAGLVASALHPNPFPHADYVTTTTHKTLRGPRGGMIMCKKKYRKAIDREVFPGMQGGPLQHVIAAKAVAFKEAMSEEFKSYQQLIKDDAKALCHAMKKRGFTIISGDTDNHLFLVDLSSKEISGKACEDLLGRVGITVNMNMIPYDLRKPMDPSGIRIGTPSVASRNMGPEEMEALAALIDDAVKARGNEEQLTAIHERTKALTSRFPVQGRYLNKS